MTGKSRSPFQAVEHRLNQILNNQRLAKLNRAVMQASAGREDQRPILFFNASSRIAWMSQNSAFQLLAALGVALEGQPIEQFICQGGMTRCQLGTNRFDADQPPPCEVCIAQSKHLYKHLPQSWFDFQPDAELDAAIPASLDDMSVFSWRGLPLGELVLPSLRWALRRHHLKDDAPTKKLLREYIRSGWNVAQRFVELLEERNPVGLVIFNGIAFPEAIARHIAQQKGLWVITHEVGLRPLTGYFTAGQATAYPIDIPAGYKLSTVQDEKLNAYLEERMQGNFTMAGIRFWPQMQGLGAEWDKTIAAYKQVVPVFTNVIFDTSQMHANVVFEDMFAWLDEVKGIIESHPETLFVIRAHPDETRPGKEADESVEEWVRTTRVDALPNVRFIRSQEPFSSYELIERSKFVMVYNSTIGLEASIMGKPVLCGGKARFTQIPTVFFPQSIAEFKANAAEMLTAETIEMPAEFQQNARTFLYYQLFKTSLPFDRWLTQDSMPGFVLLKPGLSADHLRADVDPTMCTLTDGLLRHGNFLYPNGGCKL